MEKADMTLWERVEQDPLFVERAAELAKYAESKPRAEGAAEFLAQTWVGSVKNRVEVATEIVGPRHPNADNDEIDMFVRHYAWGGAYPDQVRPLQSGQRLQNITPAEIAIAEKDQQAVERIAQAAVAEAKVKLSAAAKVQRSGRAIE